MALAGLAALPPTGAAFTATTANAPNELSAASFFTSYTPVVAGDAAGGRTGTVDLAPYRSPQPVAVPGSGWPSVAAGSNFSCAVRADGTLWCWGDNYGYRLGDGTTALRRDAPTQIGGLTTWRAVAVGASHGCATRADSTLWCWGSDESASIPDGAISSRPSAVQIGSATDWGQIAVGADLGCGLRGVDLWCWGLRAGDGSGSPQLAPVQVGAGAAWARVAVSAASHACARRTDGTLWCWGLNLDGQLGLGDTSQRLVPTQVGAATDWDQIAAGAHHTCATRTDGTLWCWGRNDTAQLGLGSTSAPVVTPTQVGSATTWAAPFAGAQHTCAIRDSATLWCWGGNSRGQLGLGTVSAAVTAPTQVGAAVDWSQGFALGAAHSCGARSDGVLRCWGWTQDNRTGHDITQLTPGPVAAEWGAIELGVLAGCGIRDVGTLWCWGENVVSLLGTGAATESRPVRIGSDSTWRSVTVGSVHGCAIRGAGSLWCWGGGGAGQLGLGDTSSRSTPTRVGAGTDWAQVAAGPQFTCAVRTTGGLWCWGLNGDGELGTGGGSTTAPVQVAGTGWASVSAGTAHACAIRSDGTLWCWGDGDFGRLGDGASVDRPVPTQVGTATDWVGVAAGGLHTCGVRGDGTLWCWGRNTWGQIGDGTATERPSPTRIGAATDWAQVAAGSLHTCATRVSGAAWCWGGANTNGELGSGETTPSSTPVQVVGVTSAVAVSVGGGASAFLVG